MTYLLHADATKNPVRLMHDRAVHMNALALTLAFLIVVRRSCVEYSFSKFNDRFRFIVNPSGHKKSPADSGGACVV